MLNPEKPVRLNHHGGALVDILLTTETHILGIIRGKSCVDVWARDGTTINGLYAFNNLVNIECTDDHDEPFISSISIPSTAQQVIDFVGSNFISCDYMNGVKEETRFILSVHDLLSSFDELKIRCGL